MLYLSRRPLTASDADRAMFVGRRVELSQALTSLGDRLNVFVAGERGAGRTSFLNQLAHRCDRQMVQARAATADAAAGVLRMVAAAAGAPDRADPTPLTEEHVLTVLAGVVDAVGEPPVIVLDDVAPDPFATLFGAFRDVLWERPDVLWVVAGDGRPVSRYLRAPADAFFQVSVNLGPLSPHEVGDLLGRRVDGNSEREREFREAVVPAVVGMTTSPAPLRGIPGQVITYASRVASLGQAARNDPHAYDYRHPLQLAWDRSESHGRAYEALMRLGSAHAGDRRLLDDLGWSRPHASRILGDLAASGLVGTDREGRRVVYTIETPP